MRRWRERYEEEGYDGLFDRRRGKPSRRRVPLAMVEKVLALHREKYFDLNLSHFHEKLASEHQVELSYRWVKQALQGAGPVAPALELFSYHIWRRGQIPVSQPLHIDILSALIFRKGIQIRHEDLQASFRCHSRIAIY